MGLLAVCCDNLQRLQQPHVPLRLQRACVSRFYTSELADLVARRNFFVPLPDLVKQPVLERLRNMRCNGELALKDAEGMARQKVVAVGVVDELVGRLLSLYTQVYKVRPRLRLMQRNANAFLWSSNSYLPLLFCFSLWTRYPT
jgi:hypothetical protein